MKDANNNDVCGFTISKSSSGTMGTVSYIVNNKVRKITDPGLLYQLVVSFADRQMSNEE